MRVLKKELHAKQITKCVFRQSRTNNAKENSRGVIIHAVLIADRLPGI
jgi:hypothetical protein